VSTVTIKSGEDRGSGLQKDREGYLTRWTGEFGYEGEAHPSDNDILVGALHTNSQTWRGYLAFDLTGVDVSRVTAASIWLYLQSVVVSDPPLEQPEMDVYYGADAWTAALQLAFWTRPSSRWPDGAGGDWSPLWAEYSGGATSAWKELAAPDVSPLLGFAGSLFEVRLQLGSPQTGDIGQYSQYGSGELSKFEPYLLLTLTDPVAVVSIPVLTVQAESRAFSAAPDDRTYTPPTEDRSLVPGADARALTPVAEQRTLIPSADDRELTVN